jgi:TolB-like protein/Flp pilus assembly protein TadD
MTGIDDRSVLRRARLGRLILVYVGGSWAVLEATDFFTSHFGLPEWFVPAALVLLLIGFVITIATALVQAAAAAPPAKGGGVDAVPDPTGSALPYSSGLRRLFTWRNALVGGGFAFGLWGAVATGWLLLKRDAREPTDMRSVAVLPFTNMSADAENEYFSDGITDDIITHLSKIADLTVISRTSVMRYKSTDKTIREIGEELGVAAVLEGGVRRSGDQVRINAQLIDVNTDAHLWAEIYDRRLTDVFAIQSDVAQQIAAALQATLTPAEKERIEQRPTENLEAYDFYLRGNAYMSRPGYSPEVFREAERHYRRAVELDPQLAVAWAALSEVHSRLYWFWYDRTPERRELARQAFERAFAIDPDLPEAHTAAGFYYYHGLRDYESALREFEAALRSEPGNANALEGAAWVYRRLGQWDRSIAHLERAAEIDPHSGNRLVTTGETLYLARRYEDAHRYFSRSLALQPDEAQTLRLWAWLQTSWRGDAQSARSLIDAAIEAAPSGALPGGDDLQPWWLLRALGRGQANRWLVKITPAVFADDTVVYHLAAAELESLQGDRDAASAAYAAAAAILERQIAADPQEARYHSELGVALAGLGRVEEAIGEGRRAVELLPIDRDALWGRAFVENLALIYVRTGQPDAALDELEALLPLAGPLTPAWLRLDPAWDTMRDRPRFARLSEGTHSE